MRSCARLAADWLSLGDSRTLVLENVTHTALRLAGRSAGRCPGARSSLVRQPLATISARSFDTAWLPASHSCVRACWRGGGAAEHKNGGSREAPLMESWFMTCEPRFRQRAAAAKLIRPEPSKAIEAGLGTPGGGALLADESERFRSKRKRSRPNVSSGLDGAIRNERIGVRMMVAPWQPGNRPARLLSASPTPAHVSDHPKLSYSQGCANPNTCSP
jgi:hypothetical protein